MKVNDHRKIYKSVYQMGSDRVELIEIPPLQFLVQEGQGKLNWLGRPETDYWAVWKTINQIKRITKNKCDYQFKLMPHEIVWLRKIGEEEWIYTEMMQVPDFIDYEIYDEARKSIEKKYRNENIPETKLQRIEQGLCIQKLHKGHYRETERTLNDLINYAKSNGFEVVGERRELYLNQPMCHPTPDKWETIVRVQVKES
ncbi:hypothetical protein Back11_57670 [Paenibacillus baekrokdamisoli]|uniref:Uncharacterized protein n=1 Tax=Paenibacillus baekrokdamisoli TaxID=1712516 RepID=A0A3G9J1I2_9BACL|nr:GyrI-like domain-containing protein [Paenibacillus baekrokdamisoli]MBB3072864.1 hypothetical protein [Paenibacillus baekrokdamisoli]BBH24422.1 hypothetical protein Back11_57670 [Paenibacillus baekrokdamisoli]